MFAVVSPYPATCFWKSADGCMLNLVFVSAGSFRPTISKSVIRIYAHQLCTVADKIVSTENPQNRRFLKISLLKYGIYTLSY